MSIKTGFHGYKGFDGKGNYKVVGKETNSFYHTDGVKPMRCVDLVEPYKGDLVIKGDENVITGKYESKFLEDFRRSLSKK